VQEKGKCLGFCIPGWRADVHLPSFWFDRHFLNLAICQQRKSQIVLMQDPTWRTHCVELGPASAAATHGEVRADSRVKALDLGGM
jgi:hypothetical protein